MKTVHYLLLITLLAFGLTNCKKKKDDPNNTTTAPVVCNLAPSTVSLNDTIRQVVKDSSFATANNTYNTQHIVSAQEGVSMDFEDAVVPAPGDYTITPVFLDVIPGSKKVYVQYFHEGQPYLGQAGKVTIKQDGGTISFEFCKIYCKNTFGLGFTVSAKSMIP